MSPSIFFFCLGVCNVHFPFFYFYFSLSREWEKERERAMMAWRIRFVWAATPSGCLRVISPPTPPLVSLIRFMYKCTLRTHTHTSHQGIRFLMVRYHRANKRRRRRQLFPLPNKRGRRHKYNPQPKYKFRMYRENGHEMLLSLSAAFHRDVRVNLADEKLQQR